MKKVLLLLLLLFMVGKSFATHIRAGEITYRNTSGLTYEVTFTTYVKESSGIVRSNIPVSWGDNTTSDVQITDSTLLSNDTRVRIYKTTHKYANAGTYVIAVTDQNRDAGVLNIPNSVNTAFYIESVIAIDAITPNNSVQFLAPPLMTAQVGTIFQHSVSAYDPDADYLTYKLISCQDAINHSVAGYSIPAGFSINNISGKILWSTPQFQGQYNFAVQVNKWKNGKIIGSVIRDFQITISAPTPIKTIFTGSGAIWKIDSSGNYAFTIAPGDSISLNVTYNDSSNNAKSLTTYSETLINGNSAVIKNTTGTGFINVIYKWKPATGNARCAPYLITFRGISLYNQEYAADLAVLIYVRNQSTRNCIAPTGITEAVQKLSNALNVYPNPVSTTATIELSGIAPLAVSHFILYDIQGREVQSRQFQGNSLIFNKGTLSKGLYLYRVISKEEIYTGKLLIE